MRRNQVGNCYVASEALYHILGRDWRPMVMRIRGGTHWFLKHKSGIILDPSNKQFAKRLNYNKAKGCGFLTKKPSRRAQELIQILTFKRPFGETGTRLSAKQL